MCTKQMFRQRGLLSGMLKGKSPLRCRRCTIYIVRRTQLYLDDQLWGALHARAIREKTSVSDLVRQAVRERYLGDRERRKAAMQEFIGSRKSHGAIADSTEEVRRLHRGSRLDRLTIGDRPR